MMWAHEVSKKNVGVPDDEARQRGEAKLRLEDVRRPRGSDLSRLRRDAVGIEASPQEQSEQKRQRR
jgi:hypothetical protein